jgi:hypothetical protein
MQLSCVVANQTHIYKFWIENDKFVTAALWIVCYCGHCMLFLGSIILQLKFPLINNEVSFHMMHDSYCNMTGLSGHKSVNGDPQVIYK